MKSLTLGTNSFDYHLGDAFFAGTEHSEITGGDVFVELQIKSSSAAFELKFSIEGTVITSCSLCLDTVELGINTSDTLIVKLGEESPEDDSDIVTVSDPSGILDLSWYMYESIALSLPLQIKHSEGECNPEMLERLNTYMTREEVNKDTSQSHGSNNDDVPIENEENDDIDPRWNKLKTIKWE